MTNEEIEKKYGLKDGRVTIKGTQYILDQAHRTLFRVDSSW